MPKLFEMIDRLAKTFHFASDIRTFSAQSPRARRRARSRLREPAFRYLFGRARSLGRVEDKNISPVVSTFSGSVAARGKKGPREIASFPLSSDFEFYHFPGSRRLRDLFRSGIFLFSGTFCYSSFGSYFARKDFFELVDARLQIEGTRDSLPLHPARRPVL